MIYRAVDGCKVLITISYTGTMYVVSIHADAHCAKKKTPAHIFFYISVEYVKISMKFPGMFRRKQVVHG